MTAGDCVLILVGSLWLLCVVAALAERSRQQQPLSATPVVASESPRRAPVIATKSPREKRLPFNDTGFTAEQSLAIAVSSRRFVYGILPIGNSFVAAEFHRDGRVIGAGIGRATIEEAQRDIDLLAGGNS